MIECKNLVIRIGILTFRNLLNPSFLLILETCTELKKNATWFEVNSLKPYTYYHVSLHAYVVGRVHRNGTAEQCFFQTKAARKFFALMFLP